jgi:hypothetical protein
LAISTIPIPHTKNRPLKATHYILPLSLLIALYSSFEITHSYFSSPIICSTTLKKLFSPFPCDNFFGSLGLTFHHQWHGIGCAHPTTSTDAQQALHWACLAAHHDPTAFTILVLPDPTWYHNFDPMTRPFPDIHIILHFEADTPF